MPIDKWLAGPREFTMPADDASLVSPSDTVDLAVIPRAIVVDGAVKVTTKSGTTLVLPDLGTWQWDLRVTRVFATGGTTATNVVALY